MKQNLGEKRVKQLFHELRQEDEQRSPSFDSVLKAGSPKAGQAGPAWFSLRVAVAAAMLILAGGLVFIFLRQSSMLPAEGESSKSPHVAETPFQLELSPYEPPPSASEAIGRKSARPVSPKRSAARSHQPAMSISRWKSPTDFLLKTLGDQFLKTVPRVGESLVEIKSIIPDEKN